MRSLYINPLTYDIETINNNLRFTENVTEWLSAKIEARLKTFYQEWFINRTIGIPYFTEILKKQVDINNVQVILSDVIKQTIGVEELVSFIIDYNLSTRKYSYTFKVTSINGILVEGGNIL